MVNEEQSVNSFKTIFSAAGLAAAFTLQGCTVTPLQTDVTSATLANRTSTYQDLKSLPQPRGQIVASVYSFRDQTGQYKPAPSSTFSTAVTQGATALLTEAMKDSGWFITLEREGLQNLLTERKIIRAAQKKPNTPENNADDLPSLLAANVLVEGGIISYDSNIMTGGSGARYLGVGASEQYQVDQVTVNIRVVNVRTGQILNNISTTKTIFSQEIQTGVFRFIEYKELLELEAGFTTNEPRELCVRSAIESALLHIIVDGVEENHRALADMEDINHPTIRKYADEQPLIATSSI